MTEIQNRFKGHLNQQKPELNKSKYLSMPSFKGHKLVEKVDGQKQFEMFLPNADNNIKLELIKLHKDANGRYTIPEHVNANDLETRTFNKPNGTVKAWTLPSKEGEEDVRYAYKFKKDGQPDILDNTQKVKINGQEYNLTTDPSRPVLALPHTMYHMMPDFFNPGKEFNQKTGDGVLDFALKNLPRNHFNKYGGTINGITNKLDYVKNLGVARILSTPVMGQDRFPTGYWTTNPLQVTSTMGSFTDFKNLHKELYKRGMGWVADGAFVNEGWEGIHLKDVMLYGEKSPFYYWFETHNFPLEPIKPGVLPSSMRAYKELGVKIVNGKQYINEEGMPQKNKEFNPKMPTYVQTYDKKLVSPDQLKNPNELIGDYQDRNYGKNAKKSTYSDGIIQYSFEVKPNEVEDRIKDWKAANKESSNPKKDSGILDVIVDIYKFILSIFGLKPGSSKKSEKKLNEFLISYSKSGDRPDSALKLVKSDQDGGITLWDGNKDIAKLRFVVTSGKKKELLRAGKTEELKKIERAAIQVQDNIIKVGGYWTNEVDKSLTEYSARVIGEKVKNLDDNEFNKIKSKIPGMENKKISGLKPEEKYLAAIYILADTKAMQPEKVKGPYEKAAILPPVIKDIIKKGELTSEHIKNMLDTNLDDKEAMRAYQGQIAPAPKSIADGIMNFPLDSIDFPAEVCSVFSSPYLKTIKNTKDKNGNLEFNKKALDPDQREVYESMQKLYTDRIVPTAFDILKKVDKENKFFAGSELTEEGRQVFRLVSSDIIKFIMIKSLANVEPSYKDKEFEYSDLREATFNNMAQFDRTSPKTAAESIIYSIKQGLGNVKKGEDDFVKSLSEKIENIDIDSIKAAKLVVNKTESGLDWRIDAAKDIADIDAIRDGKATFSESWEDVISFWKKFNTEVRTYNPKAYTIGEVTDTDKIMKDSNCGRFDGGPSDAEKKFVEETGFTTQSNYTYLYSGPQKFFHGMPEEKADYSNTIDSAKHLGITEAEWDNGVKIPEKEWKRITNGVDIIKDGEKTGHLTGYTESGPIDNINYSHTFFANHDKPRTFHNLTLDIKDFYKESNSYKLGDCLKNHKLSNGESVFDVIDKAYKQYADNNWWQKELGDNYEEKVNKIVDSMLYDNWIYKDEQGIVAKYLAESGINIDEFKNKFDLAAGAVNKYKNRCAEEQGPGNAMRAALCDAIDKAEIDSGKADKLKIAINKFTNDHNISSNFARRPFERNLKDLMVEANVKLSDSEIKAVHEEFIKPAINKFKSMMTFLTYMPGSPTLYAGDELAQTGYETKNKNVVRQNRERMKWEYIDNNKEDYREFIDDLQKDVAKTLRLRNDSRFSPLVDGYTINIGAQADNTVGIYRYNKDRDVIALFSSKDFGTARNYTGFNEKGDIVKPGYGSNSYIRLKDIGWSLGTVGNDGIVRDNLNELIIYKNANDEDKSNYLLKKDADGYLIVKEDGNIEMDKPNLLLYRERNFDGSLPG